ncbi:DoxX family protein [Chitinophaga polysaccharea]|uniref:DoxX family protein n=1 Tax=Chitinophaga polysaccharea TaxID=1293035 RepID=UPI00115A2250|nr:DoxX family protein [Chitinophaga polysaccharea]
MRTYAVLARRLQACRDIPLLFMRLVLAYGFYLPAKMKWSDIHSIGDWFVQLHMPLPYVSAYLVAIATVHWSNGFAAGDNGFEIPLYYLIMLFALFIYGGGKIGLDYFLE